MPQYITEIKPINTAYEFNEPFASFGHRLGHAPVSNLWYPESVEHREDDDYSSQLDNWVPLKGFSGQYGYNGPVMHPSEYIGGGLEDYLLENAGIYVVIAVNVTEELESHLGEPYLETESIGWMILEFDPQN